jgi:hypothetical protein
MGTWRDAVLYNRTTIYFAPEKVKKNNNNDTLNELGRFFILWVSIF